MAFGDQRKRYASAADIQKYSSIAPVTERSGKQWSVHWRCPKFLRQTFIEWANMSIHRRSGRRRSTSNGVSADNPIRPSFARWLSRGFVSFLRCWQDRQLYDDSTHLSALQEPGSPLIQNLANSTLQL